MRCVIAVVVAASALTPRWTELRPHPVQDALRSTDARFVVCPSGRRSGKTEIAKRHIVREAAKTNREDALFVCAAPTFAQAKRIFWRDLKALIPSRFVSSKSETTLEIVLVNGATIAVVGLDRPERLEGSPLDGIVVDEYGNCRPEAWHDHIRPSLSTVSRPGWAWFIGVPEAPNHYRKLYEDAKNDDTGRWAAYHWPSWDIVEPEEIEAAKKDMDELTFRREYGGEFVEYKGRAYYAFNREEHVADKHAYDPRGDLLLCFDFNVSPGVCVASMDFGQETQVIGEIWIPNDSNTSRVCAEIVQKWGTHEGHVTCYGDSTGGARGSSKIAGSDWDIIHEALRRVYARRLAMRVPKQNPLERVRVNAVNTRLKSASGESRLFVSPSCPHTIEDLESVTMIDDGSGRIYKGNPQLTHISDALGYMIAERHPIGGASFGGRIL